MRSRIYEAIERPSVCPSVCPIIRPQLLSAVRTGNIDRQRRALGAQQQRSRSTGSQHGTQQQTRAVLC